jgi:hypothetical protein
MITKSMRFGGIQSGPRLKHLAAAACFAILEAVPSSPTAGVKVGPQVNPRLPLGLLLQPSTRLMAPMREP